MKTLFLFIALFLSMPILYAQRSETANINSLPAEDRDKKLDITVKINRYTIRIYGDVRHNMLNSTIKFSGFISITGNGENISLPVDYTGTMSKGPNRYKYDSQIIPEKDMLTVEWVLSRLYLQERKNIWFSPEK